jgi:hypothetical protein
MFYNNKVKIVRKVKDTSKPSGNTAYEEVVIYPEIKCDIQKGKGGIVQGGQGAEFIGMFKMFSPLIPLSKAKDYVIDLDTEDRYQIQEKPSHYQLLAHTETVLKFGVK